MVDEGELIDFGNLWRIGGFTGGSIDRLIQFIQFVVANTLIKLVSSMFGGNSVGYILFIIKYSRCRSGDDVIDTF